MRPLIWMTVGYITGIIWGLYLKQSIVPILFILGGLIYLLKNKIKPIFQKAKQIKLCILLFVPFSIIGSIQIQYLETKHENLYKNLENIKNLEIIGTVISEKTDTPYKAHYTIKVESINQNAKYKKTNLLIYVSKKENLEYGDKIIIKGNYEEAKDATNYKTFNYKEYLKQKNIYGIVQTNKIKTIEKNNLNPILITFNKIRNKIKTNLKEILGEEPNIAIGIMLRRYEQNTTRNNRKL